ncbi:MAG: hypothetical protein R2695_05395 [Acidimicrobiales bacterium]
MALEGLRPCLAAGGTAQVVQIGSTPSTTTPDIPDDLVAVLAGDEEEAVRLVGQVPEPFDGAMAYGGAKSRLPAGAASGRSPPTGSARITLNVIAPDRCRPRC